MQARIAFRNLQNLFHTELSDTAADLGFTAEAGWKHSGYPDTSTYYYAYATNTMQTLDHFIISRGLYYGLQGLGFNLDAVQVFHPDLMASSGKNRPVRCTFSKDGQASPKGYSDHFPVTEVIEVL